jgi:hypothetical protein
MSHLSAILAQAVDAVAQAPDFKGGIRVADAADDLANSRVLTR